MQKLSRRRSGNRAQAGLNPGTSIPAALGRAGDRPAAGPTLGGVSAGAGDQRRGSRGSRELEGQPADRRRSLGAWAPGNRRQ